MIAHWDDVERRRFDVGPIGLYRRDLGSAAGTRKVGVTRAEVEAGKQSSPQHVELDEEEIFYVLAGSGHSVEDDRAYQIRAGDCIVYGVAEQAHTLVAGSDGLDVLMFGERTDPAATYLPRAKVLRMGVTVDVSQGPHPWEREAEAGRIDVPEPSPRPSHIVDEDDVEGAYGGRAFQLGRTAGALRTGLNLVKLGPGEEGASPHVHSAEEEIFIVLAGSGTLELWPTPAEARRGAVRENHELRPGHVVSRPPASGMAHAFRAGAEGLTYLAYGTREPNDIAFYPRSNEIVWRGVGVSARLEHLDAEPRA